MEINVDFSRFDTALRNMGASESRFTLTAALDPLDWTEIEALSGDGIEVKFEETDRVGPGILAYQGRQVLLYIQDHGGSVSQVLRDGATGRRFHVADCSTLQSMRAGGRFERYVVTNRLDGKFYITGRSYYDGPIKDGEASLKVCQNCLNHLNYKNVRQRNTAASVSKNFNISEFFEHYSSFFQFKPRRQSGSSSLDHYSSDWAEISERERSSVGYICQECHVDLDHSRRLLHVHHIDGNKGNNHSSNLKVLCAACHKQQPKHEAMFVSHNDMQEITRARQKNKIILDPDWEDALRYCDSAIVDAIQLLRAEGVSAPIIGVDVQDANSRVVGTLEVAWESVKVGIAVSTDESIAIASLGWHLVNLEDLLLRPSAAVAACRLKELQWR